MQPVAMLVQWELTMNSDNDTTDVPDAVISVTVAPPAGSEAGVDAGTYDSFFGDFLTCLRVLEQVVRPRRAPAASFRLVNMHMSEPTIELEPVTGSPEYAEQVVRSWLSNAQALEAEAEVVPHSDRRVLEAFDRVAAYVTEGKLGSVIVRSNGTAVRPGAAMRRAVNRVLGDKLQTHGSFVGRLEYLNTHDQFRCRIYLALGGYITCSFPEELLDEIRNAIRRRVRVSGVLHFTGSDPIPDLIEIEEVEVYPPRDELPTIGGLWGLMPDITNGKSIQQYLAEMGEDNE